MAPNNPKSYQRRIASLSFCFHRKGIQGCNFWIKIHTSRDNKKLQASLWKRLTDFRHRFTFVLSRENEIWMGRRNLHFTKNSKWKSRFGWIEKGCLGSIISNMRGNIIVEFIKPSKCLSLREPPSCKTLKYWKRTKDPRWEVEVWISNMATFLKNATWGNDIIYKSDIVKADPCIISFCRQGVNVDSWICTW